MGLSEDAFFMIKHTPSTNGNHSILSHICPMGVADPSLRKKNGCIVFGQILPIPAIVSTGDVSAGQGLLLLEKPRKILLRKFFFLLGWQSRAAEKNSSNRGSE